MEFRPRAASFYARRLSISTNHVARNQKFGLLTFHTRGQISKAVAISNGFFFCAKQQTLKGSLDQTAMKTQSKVERSSVFLFHKKINHQHNFGCWGWRGCFGQGIKWDFCLGLNFGVDYLPPMISKCSCPT